MRSILLRLEDVSCRPEGISVRLEDITCKEKGISFMLEGVFCRLNISCRVEDIL